jgi:hypothetical protein
MKNKLFRVYFVLMLLLSVFISVESRGLTFDKNTEESGSILRKPEERYPIDPNESPKGKKIIKRTFRSRTLC